MKMAAAALRLLFVAAATMALGAAQQCNEYGFYCTDEYHFMDCPGEGLPPTGPINSCSPSFCGMDCEFTCAPVVPCHPTTTAKPTTTTTETPTTTITTTTESPFLCEAEGSFPDPEDCRRFISCVPRGDGGGGFWALRLVCPQGSLFDAGEGRCSVNATCGGGSGGGECNEFGFHCVDEKRGQLCPDEGLPPQGEVFTCPQGASCRDGCPYLCWSDADACPTQPPPTAAPPAFPCKQEGKFADPDDCGAFFVCVLLQNGSFALLHPSCPAGSGFDAASGRCSSAAPCASCNAHGFRCVDATHVQVCGDSTPAGDVVACPAGTSCRTECSLECWAEGEVCPTDPPPTTPPPEAECEYEGRYPDPLDCTRYFVCSPQAALGTLVRVDFTCPPGSAYDPVSQRCGADVTCGGACNPQGFYCVDPTHVRLCERGEAFPRAGAATVTCPAGTSCDMDCFYECWGDAAGSTCPPAFKCMEQGRFPAPHSCSYFYLCSAYANGTFMQMLVACPDDSHFDADSKKCAPGVSCASPTPLLL